MKKVVVTDSVLIDANETKQIKAKNLKFNGLERNMGNKYDYKGNSSFESAYHDCELVDKKITDDKSFQEADSGLIFYYMDRILEALKKQVPVKMKIYENRILKCPCCHEEIGYFKISGESYCIYCGQKIKFIE